MTLALFTTITLSPGQCECLSEAITPHCKDTSAVCTQDGMPHTNTHTFSLPGNNLNHLFICKDLQKVAQFSVQLPDLEFQNKACVKTCQMLKEGSLF